MNRIFIIETIQLSPLYPYLTDQEIDFLIQQIEDELVFFSPSLKEKMYPQWAATAKGRPKINSASLCFCKKLIIAMNGVKFYKISELRKIAPSPVPKSPQGLRAFILKHKTALKPTVMGEGKGKRYFVKKDHWDKLMEELFGWVFLFPK